MILQLCKCHLSLYEEPRVGVRHLFAWNSPSKGNEQVYILGFNSRKVMDCPAEKLNVYKSWFQGCESWVLDIGSWTVTTWLNRDLFSILPFLRLTGTFSSQMVEDGSQGGWHNEPSLVGSELHEDVFPESLRWPRGMEDVWKLEICRVQRGSWGVF